MLKSVLQKISYGKNLTAKEAGDLIEYIAEGHALPSQIGAFLTALKMKGETPEEITGFALKMRELAPEIYLGGIDDIVDSCGTGGDCSNTFNISTACAILASASGLNVAKHSNFGFTSKSGSSNVLEALGITLVETPQGIEENLKNHNIAFIHAPHFHKCTAHVNSVRKQLGIKTVFNYLGPLTNPARPTGQVLGVACPKIGKKVVEVLNNLGCEKAFVVHGQDPTLDEISVCGKTIVYRLEKGNIETSEMHPEDFGIKTAGIEEISGDTPEINAQIIENIFEGKIIDAKLDAVLLNSAALLWVGNKVGSIEDGIKLAESLINTGMVKKKLEELKKC